MSLVDRDRARGLIYGLALGDALGWPVEFMQLPQILSKYGRGGISEPPDPALYTDDTQMSAAVAEALIEAGQRDLDVLMGAVARNFIGWKRDPITPSRAPGATSIRGVNALERGAPVEIRSLAHLVVLNMCLYETHGPGSNMAIDERP